MQVCRLWSSIGTSDTVQWNYCVQLLPLWLAPNMVTLIGFLFIIANVILLLFEVPDLVGPVRLAMLQTLLFGLTPTCRLRHGCTLALPSGFGCESHSKAPACPSLLSECRTGTPPWTTSTGNKREEPTNPADLASFSSEPHPIAPAQAL